MDRIGIAVTPLYVVPNRAEKPDIDSLIQRLFQHLPQVGNQKPVADALDDLNAIQSAAGRMPRQETRGYLKKVDEALDLAERQCPAETMQAKSFAKDRELLTGAFNAAPALKVVCR